MNYKNILLIILFTSFAALTRLTPHPPNFTPLISIAIFCGILFKNRYGFFIPFIAMVVSDVWLGFHNILFYVYFSLFLIFTMGHIFRNNNNLKNTIYLSLSGSIIFFIVSNFGVWLIGYPKNFQGLLACYYAAIPFFQNTLLSTLIYSTVFLLSYQYLNNRNIAVSKKS
jgi:hypothetical protein